MAESLRDQLLALSGVADVEIDGGDEAPTALRVRVASGADGAVVGAEVQRVLAGRGMRSRVGEGREEAPPPLFERAVEPPAPVAVPARLESISVEETAGEARVVVSSSDGRRAARSTEAGEQAVEAALIAAVGELVGGREPRVLALEWKVLEGAQIVSLVLAAGEQTGAGAAVTRATRAFAVARAAWSALER